MMEIVDIITIVDGFGLDYFEIKHRVIDIFIRKHEAGEYDIKDPENCEIKLKKVEIDFTPNSTDVGLRYTYEVIHAT